MIKEIKEWLKFKYVRKTTHLHKFKVGNLNACKEINKLIENQLLWDFYKTAMTIAMTNIIEEYLITGDITFREYITLNNKVIEKSKEIDKKGLTK